MSTPNFPEMLGPVGTIVLAMAALLGALATIQKFFAPKPYSDTELRKRVSELERRMSYFEGLTEGNNNAKK